MGNVWESSEHDIEFTKEISPEGLPPGLKEAIEKAKGAKATFDHLIEVSQQAFMALLETGQYPELVKALDEALARVGKYTNAPKD